MFNTSLFNEIGKDIFVYKNFLSKDFCDKLYESAYKIKDQDWNLVSDFGRYLSNPGLVNVDIIVDKLCNDIGLEKNAHVNKGSRILKMIKTAYMAPHADNYEHHKVSKKIAEYVEGDPYEMVENTHYGIVFYFHDFEGGELYYPTQNIVYKPEVGDLVIHSSLEHCTHGVKEVVSDFRYSYANNIYTLEMVKKDNSDIVFPGIGIATYLSDNAPENAKEGETWHRPSDGAGFVLKNGLWDPVSR